MTIEEFAEGLNACAISDEIPYFMILEAQRQHYLIIYGVSDDLIEVEGACYEEFDAFRPTTLYITSNHVYSSEEAHPAEAKPIHVEFSPPTQQQPSMWKFKTDIPHATFDITRDNELFCRGLVIDQMNFS